MRVNGWHSKLLQESRKPMRTPTDGASGMTLRVVVVDCSGKPLGGVAEAV